MVESNEEVVINHLKGLKFIWRIDAISSNVLVLARSICNISLEAIPRAPNQSADCIEKHDK